MGVNCHFSKYVGGGAASIHTPVNALLNVTKLSILLLFLIIINNDTFKCL